MILTCPSCTSRFLLSSQVLAPEGRRVKCSVCAEEWFQLPDPDELIENLEQGIEDIPESVKPVSEGASVPALTDNEEDTHSKKAMLTGYAAALVVFLVVLGGVIFAKNTMVKSWPPSAAIYELLGVGVKAPGDGLVFDRVQVKLIGRNKISIEGHIINLTAGKQVVPFIEALIRDEAGETIETLFIPPPVDSIDGEMTSSFKVEHTGAMDHADHVQVRFVLSGVNLGKEPEEAAEEHEMNFSTDDGTDNGADRSAPHAKSVSEDAGNIPAHHGDDHADPHVGESH